MSNPYEPPPPGGQPPYGAPPPYGQPPPYGAQPPYGYGPPPVSYGTNGFAIASLVCAFLCQPLGIIFGFVARGQIRQTGQQGDGLALAGIITSIVLLVVAVLWWIFAIYTVNSININNNPGGLARLVLR